MNAALFELDAPAPSHPAKYTDALLLTMANMLRGRQRILDPFGGTGKVFLLEHWLGNVEIQATEIEPEWAAKHPRTTLGNALDLPWPDGYFDAICTSPCLTLDQRLLTSDLRWIPCGDIKAGDKLIAFDEYSPHVKPGGQPARRRLQIATVTESYPARKQCVRVNLDNGESITCTHDHPWLATRYADNSRGAEWVNAENLMTLYDPHVLKQFNTWQPKTTYRAGWLAGMLDGEGSLSYGVHGSPKLMFKQAEGMLLEQFEKQMADEGYAVTRYSHDAPIPSRLPTASIYVNGGFDAIFQVLGELRPTRLLQKVETLGVKGRAINPRKARVVSVESIGDQDIQGITTSTGTYIGEGYLMHNTYGNRMADPLRRTPTMTYASELGRVLDPDNSGSLNWGPRYRDFHERAWTEARRVLASGGVFVLNIKDHIRAGQRIRTTDWHIGCLESLGFRLDRHERIDTPGVRLGQNHELRVPYESVILFELERK